MNEYENLTGASVMTRRNRTGRCFDHVIDGPTLMDMNREPKSFCVETLIPKGVCILGGAPKVYMIHQDRELWRDNVMCSYYDGMNVTDYVFSRNPRTSPIVAFVDTSDPYRMPMPQIVSEDARAAAYERLDKQYAEHMQEALNKGYYSSIYLLGDGFKEQWYTASVGAMARNRRVFVGNDLFSRGACYSLRDKYEPDETAKSHVYLGVDKLRSNIGMNVLRRGRGSYLALLDAGINWYDVKCEYELFVPEDGVLHLEIIPLDGGEHDVRAIELLELPEQAA